MKIEKITRKAIEAYAAQENIDVLELISTLQTGALSLDDDEKTLSELCDIKNEIIYEKFGIEI